VAIVMVVAGCARGSSERVYVTSGFTDEVLELDAENGEILERIALDPRPHEMDEPHGIAFAPDGQHWYATVAHGEPTLWKFEFPSNRTVGRVKLGASGAARIGIAPDGQRAFIPDYYRDGGGIPSGVTVVALRDLTVEANLTVCPAPHDARFSPGRGTFVAVTCSMSDEIVLLDAENLKEVGRFPVDSAPGPPGEPHFRPLNLVWSGSGQGSDTLFVTLHLSNEVRAFSPRGVLLGRVTVGHGPTQIARTRDGRWLVTANRMDGTMSIIAASNLVERGRVVVGGAHPHGVAVSADGSRAFVTYEGDTETHGGVVSLDIQSGSVLWSTPAGVYTLGVVYARRR
jgi:DNA-binding beta-propeller fold protein YncE